MAVSSTCVVELEPVHHSPLPPHDKQQQQQQRESAEIPQAQVLGTGQSPRRSSGDAAPGNDLSSLPAPSTAAEVVVTWNHPRSNIARVAACFWAFMTAGCNDAAYGPLIPYIQEHYGLTYLIVSLLFLSPFVGYTLSALLNDLLHRKIGQRGVGGLCACCHLAAYVIIACHPPYPVLVIAFMFAGFGNGLAEGAYNAYLGNMARSNEILGLLHGLYGVGAVLSPLIATSMITKAHLPWYAFYYMMIGMAAIELVLTTTSFWKFTGQAYQESLAKNADSAKGSLRDAVLRMPAARVSWLCAFFLLGYVGVEVSLGGWIVEFMIQVRKGEPFASGMAATGFWLGIAVGRLVLGFVTPKIGENRAIILYLLLAIGCQLLFWLVPQFIVSAVAVGLVGLFLGPLFPSAVVVMSKLLPRHLHVGAIGFTAAFGGGGAALLPFAVGAIAQAKDVKVLQPIILALLAVILGFWLGMPRPQKKEE